MNVKWFDPVKNATGYISPRGEFTGCPQCGHSALSEKICASLGRWSQAENLAYLDKHRSMIDTMQILDDLGYIKVDDCQFYTGDNINIRLTQKTAIFDMMTSAGIDSAVFNDKLLTTQEIMDL
jgi:hypothetical protein